VLSARKHIGWYVRELPGGEAFRTHMNTLPDCQTQWAAVAEFFDELNTRMDRLPKPVRPQHDHNHELNNKMETFQ